MKGVVSFIAAFIFVVVWAFLFAAVGRQKKVLRAILGVFALFMAQMAFTYFRYEHLSAFGSFLELIVGVPLGLFLVQRLGDGKMSEESAIALFLFGSFIFAVILIAILFI